MIGGNGKKPKPKNIKAKEVNDNIINLKHDIDLRKQENNNIEDKINMMDYNVENITEIGEQELCDYADVDFEYLEPYEFWIVSPWLGRKLKEYGEIVSFDFFGFTIWGRCSSGQAILLDGVISRICEELEMLED